MRDPRAIHVRASVRTSPRAGTALWSRSLGSRPSLGKGPKRQDPKLERQVPPARRIWSRLEAYERGSAQRRLDHTRPKDRSQQPNSESFHYCGGPLVRLRLENVPCSQSYFGCQLPVGIGPSSAVVVTTPLSVRAEWSQALEATGAVLKWCCKVVQIVELCIFQCPPRVRASADCRCHILVLRTSMTIGRILSLDTPIGNG